MKPVLVLDCGSRTIAELIDALHAEEVEVVVRSVPMQGTGIPLDARFPLLETRDLVDVNPLGIVISGSPHYLYTANGRVPPADFFPAVVEQDIPILGICGGHELLAHLIARYHARAQEKVPRVVGANPSGQHEPISQRENPVAFNWYVDRPEALDEGEHLFGGLPARFPAWLYHVHQVRTLPPRCTSLGGTMETIHGAISYTPPGSNTPFAFGVQFHPEISPSSTRHVIFSNFIRSCARRS